MEGYNKVVQLLLDIQSLLMFEDILTFKVIEEEVFDKLAEAISLIERSGREAEYGSPVAELDFNSDD